MVKFKVSKDWEFETTWINGFFRHYGGSVGFSQEDRRSWGVSLLDVSEVGRTGRVVGNEKCEGPGAWWTIAGYTENAELLEVTVYAVTDVYFVEVIAVERVGRSFDEPDNAA